MATPTNRRGSPLEPGQRERFVARARELERVGHSGLGPALLAAYRLRPLRTPIRAYLRRSEGGWMFSATLREILRRYRGVELGLCSTGDEASVLGLPPGTKVGNYCVLRAMGIFRREHPFERISQSPLFYNRNEGLVTEDTVPSVERNPLTIGHDVLIGEKSYVTARCKVIGDGALIEPGTIVTRDVPPYTIIAGNPGKIAGRRFSEEIEAKVRASQWFLKPPSELSGEIEDFLGPATADVFARLDGEG